MSAPKADALPLGDSPVACISRENTDFPHTAPRYENEAAFVRAHDYRIRLTWLARDNWKSIQTVQVEVNFRRVRRKRTHEFHETMRIHRGSSATLS